MEDFDGLLLTQSSDSEGVPDYKVVLFCYTVMALRPSRHWVRWENSGRIGKRGPEKGDYRDDAKLMKGER